MAVSLNTLRSAKQTSIHGRRLALDNNDFLVGPKGVRAAVIELTSATTAQTLPNYGFTLIGVSSLNTTGTNAYFIPNPTPGVSVKYGAGLATATTSTQGSTSIALQRATTAFYIESSEGTTNVAILLPYGAVVELTGMTTDRYRVTGRTAVGTALGLTGTS